MIQKEFRTNASIYAMFFTIIAMWLMYHPMLPFVRGSQITICDGSMLAQYPRIQIVPQNPIPGDSYTISTTFTIEHLPSSQTINDGTESLKITLSGFPIVNENLPLCENVPCPIGNGYHNFSWNGDVPTGVHGNVLIYEDWKMTNGTRILCFSVSYDI